MLQIWGKIFRFCPPLKKILGTPLHIHVGLYIKTGRGLKLKHVLEEILEMGSLKINMLQKKPLRNVVPSNKHLREADSRKLRVFKRSQKSECLLVGAYPSPNLWEWGICPFLAPGDRCWLARCLRHMAILRHHSIRPWNVYSEHTIWVHIDRCWSVLSGVEVIV